MKKIMIIALLCGAFASASCDKNGMSPAAPSVSEEAKAALAAKYPSASNVTWTSKSGYLVATFTLPVTRAEVSDSLAAWFDNGGTWYMTETDIQFDSLPQAIQTAFGESEYAAEPWSIYDVDKLERDGVEVVYVVQVQKYEDGVTTKVDLYWSEDGILIKMLADSANDNDYSDYIPSKPPVSVEEYIKTNYPDARITEIDHEHGMTEVDIIDGRTPRELLFDAGGAWLYTKTEVRRNDVPEEVLASLSASGYASYKIDDIDHYVTPDAEFWRFDLESAKGDVTVDITADGTLTLKQPGSGNAGGNGQMVNAEVAEFIAGRYQGAEIVKYDYDDGLLEVEIWHEGRKKDVYFNGQNAWVCTEWDVRRNELPQAVVDAIAASEWASFEIDDLEYVETPEGDWYKVELEQGKQEIKLRISAGGEIL